MKKRELHDGGALKTERGVPGKCFFRLLLTGYSRVGAGVKPGGTSGDHSVEMFAVGCL